MNRAVKAALLSAFVFPGAGHLLLKRYISGVVLTLITFTATYLQLSEMMANITPIMAKIQRGEIAPDISIVTASIAPTSANSSISSMLLIIWLVAIVDAYRIGRKQQKAVISN